MSDHPNSFPKLHNAAWPGVVGKGGEGNDPPIELDTMLDMTAAAEVNVEVDDNLIFSHTFQSTRPTPN